MKNTQSELKQMQGALIEPKATKEPEVDVKTMLQEMNAE